MAAILMRRDDDKKINHHISLHMMLENDIEKYTVCLIHFYSMKIIYY